MTVWEPNWFWLGFAAGAAFTLLVWFGADAARWALWTFRYLTWRYRRRRQPDEAPVEAQTLIQRAVR